MNANTHADLYERLRHSAKYQQLTRERDALARLSTWLVLIGLYAFIGLVAFKPALIAVPLSQAHTLSQGVPLVIGLMAFFWLLVGFYIYRANSRFDVLQQSLIHEAMERKA